MTALWNLLRGSHLVRVPTHRPAKFKREAKLSTIIGLTTTHAVYCRIYMLYRETICLNRSEKLVLPTIFLN